MSNKIRISGHELSKTKIGANEHKVTVFKNEKPQFQFNVSLQPRGNDQEFPTYQLTDKSQSIPEWLIQNLKIISGWINENDEYSRQQK